MGAQDERPSFYEGQYLAAGDLAAIVEYLRTAQARHQLGAHAWGIAIGLHLTERNAPGEPERREVILQPGLAWDGFGRAIVVMRPARLAETGVTGVPRIPDLDDPASPGGLKGRLVKVWLQYDESAARPPASGFENCATDDPSARVRESFRVVFGEQAGLNQRARISVGGQSVEAPDAIKHFDGSSTVVWDASIPHQTFPEGKPPRWLVPIGYVRWIALDDTSGYFANLTLVSADLASQRAQAFRRYLGVITEDVAAANRAIVLRARDDKPDAPHHYAALMSDPARVDALQQDLVWVEGNLRVRGDGKINGGDLHFRNADGDDKGTPIFLSRHGDSQAVGGKRELRAVIGDDAQKDNKLVVGPLQAGSAPIAITPRLVVVSGSPDNASEGRVGVNTGDPAASLEVKGDWTNDEEGAVRISGQQPAIRFEGGADVSDAKWITQLTSSPKGAYRIAYRAAPGDWRGVINVLPEKVGIRSNNPTAPLAVRADGAESDLVALENRGGGAKWNISLFDDEHLSFVEAGGGQSRLLLKRGGNIGIGTTNPEYRLDVPGGWFRFGPGNDSGRIFADYGPQLAPILKISDADDPPRIQFQQVGTGDEQNPQYSAWIGMAGGLSNNLAIMNANVGIGTANPQQKVHVGGNFLRVDGAGNEQAYIGGDGSGTASTKDVQIGSFNTAVSRVHLWNTGYSGWMSLRCSTLYYQSLVFVSDARLKQQVQPLSGSLDRVCRLRGVRFEWDALEAQKYPPRQASKEIGLIAQEVAQVLPEATSEIDEGELGISVTPLLALLIESVKELRAEVDELRSQVKLPTSSRAKKKPRRT